MPVSIALTELTPADQTEEEMPMEENDHLSENASENSIETGKENVISNVENRETVEGAPLSTVDVESMSREIVLEVLCSVDEEILVIETKGTTGLLDENSSNPASEGGVDDEVDQIDDKKATSPEP